MAAEPIANALAEMLGDKGMILGYYLVAEFMNSDGRRLWLADYPEDQPLSHSVGLVEWARMGLATEASDYFQTIAALAELEDDDEEDDE